MISLIIPATSQNQHYTDFTVSKIRELYPNEQEVEIVVEINDFVSLGINYNNAILKAQGEIIVLLHNDTHAISDWSTELAAVCRSIKRRVELHNQS